MPLRINYTPLYQNNKVSHEISDRESKGIPVIGPLLLPLIGAIVIAFALKDQFASTPQIIVIVYVLYGMLIFALWKKYHTQQRKFAKRDRQWQSFAEVNGFLFRKSAQSQEALTGSFLRATKDDTVTLIESTLKDTAFVAGTFTFKIGALVIYYNFLPVSFIKVPFPATLPRITVEGSKTPYRLAFSQDASQSAAVMLPEKLNSVRMHCLPGLESDALAILAPNLLEAIMIDERFAIETVGSELYIYYFHSEEETNIALQRLIEIGTGINRSVKYSGANMAAAHTSGGIRVTSKGLKDFLLLTLKRALLLLIFALSVVLVNNYFAGL